MLAKIATSKTTSLPDLGRLQAEQFRHDQRNHSDIACLAKSERLKHYGLHFAKYVGRLARETKEAIPFNRTVTDTTLVCLSAANTLHQNLNELNLEQQSDVSQIDVLRPLADAAGRFADACEKIDHLEEFLSIARVANQDILSWALWVSEERGHDLLTAIADRRRELAARQFFIRD